MNLRSYLLYIPLLTAAILAALPIVYLVFGSLWSSNPGYPGEITGQNYAAVASDPTLGAILLNTVAYALGAAALAVVLATALAVAIQRTDAPLRRLVGYSLLLVLTIPWFVEDMAWNFLLGPRTGLYNVLLSRILAVFNPGLNLLGSSLFNVNSMGGMVWVMGLSLTPLAYLIISPSLSLMDPFLEEASLLSGARLRTTFLKIDLGLAAPSILSAGLLCLVIAIEAFDAAQIIGVPGGFYVLASTVFRFAGGQLIPDYGLATAYAVIMLAVTTAAISLYAWSVRASRRYVTVSGRAGAAKVFALGRLRWLVGAGFLLYIIVYPVSIIGTLVLASLQFPVWSPVNLTISFRNYPDFFLFPGIGGSIANSAFVGLSAAAASLTLGAWIAYVSNRLTGKAGRALELLASLPLGFPTVVLGVGLLWALVFSPLPIYGTIWALTLAYTIRYVPIVGRFLSGPMLQVGRELEEISRICGAGTLRTVRRVMLPLLRPSLLASAVYVLIVSMKDLGAALMLATGRNLLFSAAIFDVYIDEPLRALVGGVLFVGGLSLVLIFVAGVLKVNLFSVTAAEARSASFNQLSEKRSRG